MENLYDVIIVGAGPAGLTAALYLARAKYRVLVLEKERFGGQIAITEEVVNYPGIAKTSGSALTATMKQQAEAFGAEFRMATATGFSLDGDVKTVKTDAGELSCLGILLATGAHPRTVGFRGEEAYKGRGVAYCATCDGEFFTGKEIFVVGGGYAAAEESVFLTKFARHVTVLIRKDDFSCAPSVAEEAKNHEKITVLTNTVLEEVSGNETLTYARYKNTATGAVTEVERPEGLGVFVLAGYAPETDFLRGTVELTEGGYIATDPSLKTSAEGVYAAGDVCVKPLRQVVTATGDGALAATELEKYVAAMQKKTGLRAKIPEKKVSREEESPFSGDMGRQLTEVFAKMAHPLRLKVTREDSTLSKELEDMLKALVDLTDKLTVESDGTDTDAPCVRICREDGTDTGLAFHGVPGGHEFTSFILGLYNAAGPGQSLTAQQKKRIDALPKLDLKILVTLSCSMCPELVQAAQRIAAENAGVTAQVYDVTHFPKLREQYQVMSVPCLICNNTKVSFGKKTLDGLLDWLESS